MSRAIDGAVLTEWISGECKSPSCPKNESAFGMRIMKHIDRMPTIEPEPKWIPCVDGNEPKANAECWISTSAKYVRRASYAPKANNQPNGFIVTDGGFGFYKYGESAKAWMPYTQEPEPYRGEGERGLRVNRMDKYGYIGIETLLNFCENSKDHSVTPNDFMRMKRVRMPERRTGKWIEKPNVHGVAYCSLCDYELHTNDTNYCPNCGADMRGEQNGQTSGKPD